MAMDHVNTLLPILLTHGCGGGNSRGSNRDVMSLLKGLVAADTITKVVPLVVAGLGKWLAGRTARRQERNRRASQAALVKEKRASIVLHRTYGVDNSVSSGNTTFDALVWRMCSLPQTRFLKLASNNIYVISNTDVIELDDGLCVKQLSVNFDENNNVQSACVEVFSYADDLLTLKDTMATLVHQYRQHLDNQLGQDIFYFDSVPNALPRTMEWGINYDAAPRSLTFTMSKMQTNKCLDNVYGSAMKKVRQRVRFFLENKRWYADRGVPYTLGILLHGIQGSGKSSCVKAVSKDCRRHIFNIKLNECMTVSQLTNLFYNENINVVTEGMTRTLNIPIDQRLIVFEDIDCLTRIVSDRNIGNTSNMSTPRSDPVFNGDKMRYEQFQQMRPTPMTIKPSYLECMPSELGTDLGDLAMFQAPGKTAKQMVDTYAQAHANAANAGAHAHTGAPPPPEEHPEKLTLSVILNLMDGVLETPGRILIVTTNHPEKLDKAFIRPGRIDLNVHFGRCTHEDIQEMVCKLSGHAVSTDMLELYDVPHNYWTPAELLQCIFENNESVDDILAALANRS